MAQELRDLSTRLRDHDELKQADVKIIKEQAWVYDHEAKGEISKFNTCTLCRRKTDSLLFAHNDKFDLDMVICTRCLKKIPDKKFANCQVSAKIIEMGFSEDIIIDSGSNIVKIVDDTSEYIYSYLLQSGDSTEVSPIQLNREILHKLYQGEDFSPLSAIGVIVSHMYMNNCVIMTKKEIENELNIWNGDGTKYWHIDTITRYLSNNKHSELAYDGQFMLVRYRVLEEKLLKLLNGINAVVPLDKPIDKTLFTAHISLNKKVNKKYVKKTMQNI